MYTDKSERIISQEIIDKIIQSLSDLRFGSVQITVQDFRVVQIDKTEKIRFTEDNSGKSTRK